MTQLNNPDKKPIVSATSGVGYGSDGTLGGITASQQTVSVTVPLKDGKTSITGQVNSTSFTGFSGNIPVAQPGTESTITRPGYQAPVGEAYTGTIALNKTWVQTARHMANVGVRVDGGLVSPETPVYDALALPHANERSVANTVDKKPIGMLSVNGSYSLMQSGAKTEKSATVFAAGMAGSATAATAGLEVAIQSKDAHFSTAVHSAQVGQSDVTHSTGGFNKPGSFKANLYAQTYLSAASDYRTASPQELAIGGNPDVATIKSTRFGDQYLGDAVQKNPDGTTTSIPQYNVENYTIAHRDYAPQHEPYKNNRVTFKGGLGVQYAVSPRVSVNANAEVMTNPIKPGAITLDGLSHTLATENVVDVLPARADLTPAPGQTQVMQERRFAVDVANPGEFVNPMPKFQGAVSVGVKITLGK